MLPIQKKSRAKFFNVKPFPSDITAVGVFTGLDVEVFDKTSVKALYEAGCYGLNPKPRQALKNREGTVTDAATRREEEWREMFGDNESFSIPKSSVLFLEETFFLHHTIKCVEVQDIDENKMTTEDIWMRFCRLKEKFVESFVAYLYLKSKNWVIKPGMKFGGDFREFLFESS
jgi:hypothetical protein